MALTNKQAYDITNMNVAAQKANLGQLINDIIAKAGTKLTDKQVYDLTHMNDKLDKFYGKLEEVSVILNQCYAVDKHILEVVSERKETLDMQIQDKEEK